MSWGWIKKLKDFGSKLKETSQSVVNAGKKMLFSAKEKLQRIESKGNSWLDKAENFLGRSTGDDQRMKIQPIRGNIQPRYRNPSDYFGSIS
jgi:hypothetical protein